MCAEAKTLGGFKALGRRINKKALPTSQPGICQQVFQGMSLIIPASAIFLIAACSVDSIVSDVASELSVSDFEPS